MEDLLKILKKQKTKNKINSVKFPVFKNSEAIKTSVTELNIESYKKRILLRKNLPTIGDIIKYQFYIKDELKMPIDNLLTHACCCYYSKLSEDEKKEFLEELARINKIK